MGLWIQLLTSSGKERTLDISTDISTDLTGNDRDSGYNYGSPVAMTGTLDSLTDLS